MDFSLDFVPQSISVIGQGKLGAPIAAALATRGFGVLGVDSDSDRVAAIQKGQPVVQEPGYAQLLEKTQGRLSATTDVAHAVLSTDASMIIVPTPSGADGGFVLAAVLSVCEAVGQALQAKEAEHLVVITSTVMPGDTHGLIRQTLERASDKQAGRGFLLCYSPEFVALGSVVRDYLSPDLVLIGQFDERSGDALASIALKAAENTPPVARLSLIDAELAKIAVNTYVTTKITFANTLAAICSGLPGADVDAVTDAIGLDPRIGKRYLRGGLSYGGPCFPRDNKAMSVIAQKAGADDALPVSVDAVNRGFMDRLAGLVVSQTQPGQTIAVLGLAYKPGTNVTEESCGMALISALAERDILVVAFDPQADPGSACEAASSLEQAVIQADVLVLTTPWPEIIEALPGLLAASSARKLVIDGWRALAADQIQMVADLIAVGIGADANDPLQTPVTMH